MDTLSQHLLVELHGCDVGALDDRPKIEALMREAAEAAGATVRAALFQGFAEQGVSGVIVLQESHLSIHTWPEHAYAAVDMFTCGDCTPARARDVLSAGLGATHVETLVIERGRAPATTGMRVLRYQVGPPDEAPRLD